MMMNVKQKKNSGEKEDWKDCIYEHIYIVL